jgi:hypothetical protein
MKTRLLPSCLLAAALAFACAVPAHSAPAEQKKSAASPLAEPAELKQARDWLDNLLLTHPSDNPAVENARAEVARLEALHRASSSSITVDFPGGTISQFVTAVAQSGGAPFNVVGEKSDLAAELPPLSLRNASPDAVANALAQLLRPNGLNVVQAPFEPGTARLFTLTRSTPPPVMTESIQMAPYLRTQSIDEIVDAIRAAWTMDPANSPNALQLKFHPATKLLLVSGSPAATALTRRIVSSLSIDQPPRDSAAAAAPTPKK